MAGPVRHGQAAADGSHPTAATNGVAASSSGGATQQPLGTRPTAARLALHGMQLAHVHLPGGPLSRTTLAGHSALSSGPVAE